MKKVTLSILVFMLILPCGLYADTFLGLPVPSGGQVMKRSDGRIEILYDEPAEKTVAAFSRMLKPEKDVKFRKRGDQVIIEDHGAREWHSIAIAGRADKTTMVTIVKDSWSWILGTLVLRFFGVFAVLVSLYAAMAISGAIIRRVFKAEGQTQ